MSIIPILPGRVPNSLVATNLQAILQSTNQQLTNVQEQISTGHKLSLPSDDPYAAAQTITMQQLLNRKTQIVSNINSDAAFLNASDSALSSVTDALNQAKTAVMAGIGDGTDKTALIQQMHSLITQVATAGNTSFNGRYLFGGSQSLSPPFTVTGDGVTQYSGDTRSVNSLIDIGQVLSNNIDGNAAFGALSAPIGSDVNPALTLTTKISDLFGGQGTPLGPIQITLDDGVQPQTQTVDLTGAKSVGDIKALIENAFPGGISVDINSNQNGLAITPTIGTVAVADVPGGQTASALGITSYATPQIVGKDLDPRVTLTTSLASLNGGTGIGDTYGTGLTISNGLISKTVDLSSAKTVEDVLNLLNDPSLGLSAQINTAGNGFAVSTRLSGVDFSIGENGGTNATNLGLRTMTGSTALVDLNHGVGVPINDVNPLQITRRDGTSVSVDLSGSTTVDDVLAKINAVDPGNLVASLNAVGNGISLTDNSGVGPLAVTSDPLSQALGMGGTETGGDPAVPLAGADPNPQEATGALGVLGKALKALETGNNSELTRLGSLLDTAVSRLSESRAGIGSREQVLQSVQSRLQDQQVQLQQSISNNYDTDLSTAITQLVSLQTTFQAALHSAAQTMQLTLYNYL